MSHATITSREQQILELVAFEHSTKEIAAKLFISNLTVMTHRRNLMLKMNVKNTAGLVRKGFEKGLLRLGVVDNADSHESSSISESNLVADFGF